MMSMITQRNSFGRVATQALRQGKSTLIKNRLVKLQPLSLWTRPAVFVKPSMKTTKTTKTEQQSVLSRELSLGPSTPNGRPISPHVQIYKFPLNAVSSVANRATGIASWGGFMGIAAAGIFADCDVISFVEAFQTAVPALVPVAKGAVAFPLIYHWFGGVRHLYWDMTAKHMDLKSVDKSTFAVFGASGVLTLASMFYWAA